MGFLAPESHRTQSQAELLSSAPELLVSFLATRDTGILMPPIALHLHKAKNSSEGKSLLV